MAVQTTCSLQSAVDHIVASVKVLAPHISCSATPCGPTIDCSRCGAREFIDGMQIDTWAVLSERIESIVKQHLHERSEAPQSRSTFGYPWVLDSPGVDPLCAMAEGK